MIAAALLHDVVEDTPCTFREIIDNFGEWVYHMVEQVTDISKLSDGNRAVRKAIDRAHISRGDYYGKTIKLADLIDNTKTICLYDKNFAKVYMREKRELLSVLKDGNKELYEIASNMVEEYFKKRDIYGIE